MIIITGFVHFPDSYLILMLFGLIVFQIIYPVYIYSSCFSSLDSFRRAQQQPFFFLAILVSVALQSPAAEMVTAPVAPDRDIGMSKPPAEEDWTFICASAMLRKVSSTLTPVVAVVSKQGRFPFFALQSSTSDSETTLLVSDLFPIKTKGNYSGLAGDAFEMKLSFHLVKLSNDSLFPKSKTRPQTLAPRQKAQPRALNFSWPAVSQI